MRYQRRNQRSKGGVAARRPFSTSVTTWTSVGWAMSIRPLSRSPPSDAKDATAGALGCDFQTEPHPHLRSRDLVPPLVTWPTRATRRFSLDTPHQGCWACQGTSMQRSKKEQDMKMPCCAAAWHQSGAVRSEQTPPRLTDRLAARAGARRHVAHRRGLVGQ
jgi:hypothetical protein